MDADEAQAKLIRASRNPEFQRRYAGYSAGSGKFERNIAGTGDPKWAKPTVTTDASFGIAPVLRKRTPAERAESLANRLWQSVKDHDPAQTELVLKLLYEDAWKRGAPISYDEVKQVAIEQMRLAALKAGASY